MRAPAANPPTLTAAAMSCAFAAWDSGEPTECNSASHAVAVEATMPIAMPLRSRAMMRASRLFEARKTAALCWADRLGRPVTPLWVTADFAYLRLHGRNSEGYLKGKSVAERFAWRYDDGELEQVADRVAGLA